MKQIKKRRIAGRKKGNRRGKRITEKRKKGKKRARSQWMQRSK